MLLSASALTLSMVSCRDEETENPVESFSQKTEYAIQPFSRENTSTEDEKTAEDGETTTFAEIDHSDKGDDMPKK